jgi:diaminohydroxyphosphoribosylaminopyrimidine deaminase / 5-amino-6-(5-phosphoribosylamino)uracil reductase
MTDPMTGHRVPDARTGIESRALDARSGHDGRALDARFMALALDLSRRGLGSTWPNPSVGAVLVKRMGSEPVIVGRGYTQPGGRPHGEAMALEQAGPRAAGATLYVALEPCAFRSVRGGIPCVERTLAAGIGRVVSAIDDPHPRIAGLGHALLRSAGIPVDVGLMADDAAQVHRGHFRRVRKGLPSVTFKVAQTADGYAGGPGRARIAISCPEATAWVHLQRLHHDAIMLGVDSAIADDPQLTVRLPGLAHRSPVRVVLDSRLRLPAASKLVTSARVTPTWVIAAEDAPVAPETALVAAGVEVMRVARGPAGHLDLESALALLATRGITRVFSEGGPTVGEQLALQGLADEVIVSTSPRALGEAGIVAVRPQLAALLAAGERYRLARHERIGDDSFEFYQRID